MTIKQNHPSQPSPSKSLEDKRLTDVELELMNILWKMGEGSVSDVITHLSPTRKLAYTSVSTILRILEQKNILTNRKEGRGHIYIPILKKSDYEANTVQHIVQHVFEGTPLALVKQLLSTGSIKEADLDELKLLLAAQEAKNKDHP
jgi:predicted transcriptional regulator